MTLVTCREHPACQYDLDTDTHHNAEGQPDSPSERAMAEGREYDRAAPGARGHEHELVEHGHATRPHEHPHGGHLLPGVVKPQVIAWAAVGLGLIDLGLHIFR